MLAKHGGEARTEDASAPKGSEPRAVHGWAIAAGGSAAWRARSCGSGAGTRRAPPAGPGALPPRCRLATPTATGRPPLPGWRAPRSRIRHRGGLPRGRGGGARKPADRVPGPGGKLERAGAGLRFTPEFPSRVVWSCKWFLIKPSCLAACYGVHGGGGARKRERKEKTGRRPSGGERRQRGHPPRSLRW